MDYIEAAKPWRDKATLEYLYNVRQKTQKEIADRFGKSDATICRQMQSNGVESRPLSVANTLAKPGAGHVLGDARGYEMVKHSVDDTTKNFAIHRLAAVAWFDIDPFDPEVHVHHKDGMKLHNAENNIEIKDKRSHHQEHYKNREIDEQGRFC
jgi:hypothetical protein